MPRYKSPYDTYELDTEPNSTGISAYLSQPPDFSLPVRASQPVATGVQTVMPAQKDFWRERNVSSTQPKAQLPNLQVQNNNLQPKSSLPDWVNRPTTTTVLPVAPILPSPGSLPKLSDIQGSVWKGGQAVAQPLPFYPNQPDKEKIDITYDRTMQAFEAAKKQRLEQQVQEAIRRTQLAGQNRPNRLSDEPYDPSEWFRKRQDAKQARQEAFKQQPAQVENSVLSNALHNPDLLKQWKTAMQAEQEVLKQKSEDRIKYMIWKTQQEGQKDKTLQNPRMPGAVSMLGYAPTQDYNSMFTIQYPSRIPSEYTLLSNNASQQEIDQAGKDTLHGLPDLMRPGYEENQWAENQQAYPNLAQEYEAEPQEIENRAKNHQVYTQQILNMLATMQLPEHSGVTNAQLLQVARINYEASNKDLEGEYYEAQIRQLQNSIYAQLDPGLSGAALDEAYYNHPDYQQVRVLEQRLQNAKDTSWSLRQQGESMIFELQKQLAPYTRDLGHYAGMPFAQNIAGLSKEEIDLNEQLFRFLDTLGSNAAVMAGFLDQMGGGMLRALGGDKVAKMDLSENPFSYLGTVAAQQAGNPKDFEKGKVVAVALDLALTAYKVFKDYRQFKLEQQDISTQNQLTDPDPNVKVEENGNGVAQGSFVDDVVEDSLDTAFNNGRVNAKSLENAADSFKGKTVDDIAQALERQGYQTRIRQSVKAESKAKIIEIVNQGGGKNVTQVQISPGGKRHGSLPYIKFSTSDQGIIKIVFGSPSQYITDGFETATIIFTGGN